MARLHVLGSGGWVPTAQRQTCCYLLEARRTLIVFDCGTGLSRLHDPAFQIMIQRHSRAIVLLSHWHHDHVEGLHYLPFFLKGMEVVLGVPGKGLTGRAPAPLLDRFAGKPFLPHPISSWGELFPRGFRVEELEPGRNEVLGEEIIATPQPHSDPSVGFRVRDVAYVTDTCVRDETVALADGAAVLVHDAFLDDEGARENPQTAAVHGVASDVAQLAAQAGVGDLVLAHVNPSYGPERLDRMLLGACEVYRRTLLASDMMVLTIMSADDVEEPPQAAEAQVDTTSEGEVRHAGPEPVSEHGAGTHVTAVTGVGEEASADEHADSGVVSSEEEEERS